MKVLGFDIEISNVFELRPGEDINKYAPFDVAVAATQLGGSEHHIWYSPASDGKPLLNMDRRRARELLDYLEQMQKAEHAVCAWNGLSFDLRWIARAADDARQAQQGDRHVRETVSRDSAGDGGGQGRGVLESRPQHARSTGADIVNEAIYGGGDFTKIPGLLIRTPDGPLRTAKPRAYENLDELPFMAWDRIDFSKFVGQHYCQSDKQRFAGHH